MTRILLLLLVYLLLLQYTVAQTNLDDQSYQSSSNAIRYYEFNVTLKSINPDCSDYTSPAFVINDQMPGPTISANQGDKIRVLVRNKLPNLPDPADNRHSVAIHFHGIRQYGSVHADGVPHLTQLPIRPGHEFIHEFTVVNQAGTFFYHGHVGLQEATMFGPIIVYESEKANPEILKLQGNATALRHIPLTAGPFKYDYERTIMLSEWWHRPALEFEKHVMGPHFTFLSEAESILINGRSLFNSKQVVTQRCGGYEVITVEPGKIYRLRVIGGTVFRTLSLAIANHNLTIIEVDGELTKPYTVSQLEVGPGQRFSVLLRTEQQLDDYSIKVARRWSDTVARHTNGIAVLRYSTRQNEDLQADARDALRLKKPVQLEYPLNSPGFEKAHEEKPGWIWSKLEPLYGVDPIVEKQSSRTIKFRSTEKRLPDKTVRWFVNGVSFKEDMGRSPNPILYDILNGTRPLPNKYDVSKTGGYNPNLGTYPISYFEIVDLVFQTTHIPGEPCRSHPWHTHGHSHWEIANGKGEYIEERDKDIRNIKTPLAKDVTMVYPSVDVNLFEQNGTRVTEPVGCGWSKVRIVSDNPGIWAVHCHNTPHMLMGMMFALEEAPELVSKMTLPY